MMQRKAIEKELFKVGSTPERVHGSFQDTHSVTKVIFEKWAEDVLFLNAMAQQERPSSTGEPSILRNTSSCHDGDGFLESCAKLVSEPICRPPHSGHQA
jgi:hypothetical protein